ncbi:MAG: GNAT family N-acetyltransferase [Leptospiraceae bacterium]|nr:GNAT family N-acetyltransferase [Leptospiraceae bacterium]
MELNIRKVQEEDIEDIFQMICELAEFEKLTHLVEITKEKLKKDLITDSSIQALVAIQDSERVGYAIYFYNYSTFLGKKGIYLEDLYVRPKFRKLGIGKNLLLKLIEQAKNEDLGRVEWSVLDWNKSAIDFYVSLGASVLPDWRICRVVI